MIGRWQLAARTLVGPWLAILVAGVDIAVAMQRGSPWRGEGLWTVEWFAIPLSVVAPLVAAAAAVDAARLTRPGALHLVTSVPRPWRAFARVVAWCAGPAIAVHVTAVVAALVVGGVRQPSVSWWLLAAGLGVQALVLVWSAAVGSAIGRYLSPVFAGLAGAVVVFVVEQAFGDAGSHQQFLPLAVGGATISRIGYSYNVAYLAAQLLLLGVTTVILVALPVTLRRGARVPTPVGWVVVAVAVAMFVGGVHYLPQRRLLAQPRPPTLCVGSAPQICVYPEHRRYLGLVEPRVRELVAAARAAGYPGFVPVRVVESSRTYRAGGAGVMSFTLWTEAYETGRLPSESIPSELLTPSHCPQMYAEEPPPPTFDETYFSLLATWLSLNGETLQHAPVPYRHLEPAQVQSALDAFARCDLNGSG